VTVAGSWWWGTIRIFPRQRPNHESLQDATIAERAFPDLLSTSISVHSPAGAPPPAGTKAELLRSHVCSSTGGALIRALQHWTVSPTLVPTRPFGVLHHSALQEDTALAGCSGGHVSARQGDRRNGPVMSK
jgi:hypothetical protein